MRTETPAKHSDTTARGVVSAMDMHEPDHDDSSAVDSMFLKMLVSDAIAGAVIGKSGGNISGNHTLSQRSCDLE